MARIKDAGVMRALARSRFNDAGAMWELARSRPPGEEAEIVARYRATDQFKCAWEIIAPDPERQAECEHRIVYAILQIQREVLFAKRRKTIRTAVWKKDLKKRIKKLQAAEAAVEDEHLADRLIDERERMEKELAMLDKYAVVEKGKPPLSVVKASRQFIKQTSFYAGLAVSSLAFIGMVLGTTSPKCCSVTRMQISSIIWNDIPHRSPCMRLALTEAR
jgi:hypothetical protein